MHACMHACASARQLTLSCVLLLPTGFRMTTRTSDDWLTAVDSGLVTCRGIHPCMHAHTL